MPYATADEVISRMGHPGSTDVNLTVRVEDAIAAATTAIDSDTGRVFTAAAAVARTFRSPGCRDLRVPDFVSVTSVKVDDNDDGTFETTIAASGYELDTIYTDTGWPYDTIRLLDRAWPAGGRRQRRIEITATWGWAAVPAPINQACTLLAARLAQRPSAALFGVVSFGDMGASYVRNQDPDYMHLIAPYRIYGAP